MKAKRTFIFVIEEGWDERDLHDAVEEFVAILKRKRVSKTVRLPRVQSPKVFNSKNLRRGRMWIRAVQGFYPFDNQYNLTLEAHEK